MRTLHFLGRVGVKTWMALENVTIDQWLCATEDETAVNLDPDSILGSLNDIEEDLRTHSRKYEHQLMQNAAQNYTSWLDLLWHFPLFFLYSYIHS